MPSSQPIAGYSAVDPAYLSKQPTPMASSTEPNRNKSYDPKNAHITEQQITRSNWYKHVNWLNIVLILGVPFIGCVKAATTPLQLWTAVFAVAYYFATGLGITAGYHRQGLRKSRHNTNMLIAYIRLWAHTSYSATTPLRIFLALTGAGAVEGSGKLLPLSSKPASDPA